MSFNVTKLTVPVALATLIACAAVAQVILVSGCGPRAPEDQRPLTQASESVKPSAGSDFSTVDLPSLTLQIPSDWIVADLTRGGLDARLEEVAKTNPELKEDFLLIRQAADNKSFLMYAFKTKSSDQGFTDNLYVQQTPVQGNPTLKDVASHLDAMVKDTPGAKPGPNRVEKLGGIEWQRTEWSMDLSGGGQEVKLRLFNFATLHEGQLITLNFTAKEQSVSGMENDANAILASVKLK